MPFFMKKDTMEEKKKKRIMMNLVLLVILMGLSILSIGIGVEEFSFFDLLKGHGQESFLMSISRLPRTLSIIITGAGLSMAGLIMQTITNNKFVSPSTAGTMEWCRLGVAIAILCFGGQATGFKVTFAFLVSLGGTMLFMMLLQGLRVKNAFIVPLVGMMMGNVVSSVTTFFAYQYDIIQNMSSWLQGNFSLIIKGRYEILYLGIPCLILVYVYASRFTIAGMGEEFATGLGLSHKKIVMLGLIIVAFLTSLIVVTIGSIPFIGLIIPNIVSLYHGDNLKGTLFETAMLGAIFVMLCDILGRIVIAPYEISISVIVSVLGSFIFIILLFWKNKKGGAA